MCSLAIKNIAISFLCHLSPAQTTVCYLLKPWKSMQVFVHCMSLKGPVGNGYQDLQILPNKMCIFTSPFLNVIIRKKKAN